MFTKLAEYLLPHLADIAEVKLAAAKKKEDNTAASSQNKSDEKNVTITFAPASGNESDRLSKVLKTTQAIQNIAGTAALGLGAFAIGKSMYDKAKEKKERERTMERQLYEYLGQARPSGAEEPERYADNAEEDKHKLIDDILKKAAEAEIFAKPRELMDYRDYLLQLPREQLLKKVAELEEEIARKQLKIGEALGTGAENAEINIDPLTQWLLEKASYKG
jgi:Uri superfamily endonuclease